MRSPFKLLSTILVAGAASGLVFPARAFADDPGGSSGSDDSASASAYVAIGAGVVIAGLLLLDALSDSDGVPAVEPSPLPETDPGSSTGIDWSSVISTGSDPVDVITVVPRDESLQGLAGLLIGELDSISGFPVYDEPLILGEASGMDAYSLARDFFDAGWMVSLYTEADSVRMETYGPEGLLDSRFIARDGAAAAAGFVIDALAAAGY